MPTILPCLTACAGMATLSCRAEFVAVRLALVEETPFRDAGLVLGCHLYVGRGQQEDLVGHPLDAPVQPEDQSGREVDETLGVAVDHLDRKSTRLNSSHLGISYA